MPSQVVEAGTMDLAAQARGEDVLISARLYLGAGRGRATAEASADSHLFVIMGRRDKRDDDGKRER